MTARKRKPNPKHEDEAPVKKAKTKNATPTKRAAAPRAAKVDRNAPEWLVTNENSPLAYENLHAELGNPKTYEGFTKSDWEDLREVLPANIPLNPDGYSISIDFLKYDLDFRNGVREFQEDLGSGRLDPKWLAAADDAMEERARGEFDAWKEKEYEEFWGQKQKLAYTALAGESTTLKLEVMIEHGVFRVGDEIVLTRAIGRKDQENRVLLDKDSKIISIGQKSMTLAIPPGRQKFLRYKTTPPASTDVKSNLEGSKVNGATKKDSSAKNHKKKSETPAENKSRDHQPTEATAKDSPILGNLPSGWENRPPDEPIDDNLAIISSNPVGHRSTSTDLDFPENDAIMLEITSLKQLHDKIVELDGRLDPKNQKEAPAISPWKIMRAKRNNQDLGSLFEMREDFYVYKLPGILNSSKR
ncbi:hypothetical protein ACLMJK_001634 [Lecanora helva]